MSEVPLLLNPFRLTYSEGVVYYGTDTSPYAHRVSAIFQSRNPDETIDNFNLMLSIARDNKKFMFLDKNGDFSLTNKNLL